MNQNPVINIQINNVNIKQVHETKLLGVTVDSRLSWKTHINNIIAKMGRGISIMKRHAIFLTSNIMNYAMKALILTYLDYCPAVWSNATGECMNKLQLIQNRAARVALRCSYRRNIILMHKDLNWVLVEDRLLYSLLILIRNISISKLPSVLFKHLSFSVDNHQYSTRHATKGNFTLPIARTNAIKNTVMFRGMKEWNKLPKHIILTNNVNKFKLYVKQHLSK
jgi:hypothetical protein